MLISSINKIIPKKYSLYLVGLLVLSVFIAIVEIVALSLLFKLISYANGGGSAKSAIIDIFIPSESQIVEIFSFFLIFYLISSLLKLTFIYFSLKVANNISSDLSISLSKSILLAGYQRLLSIKNPEELIASLNAKVGNIASKGVFQYLSFYSSLIVVLFIGAFSSIMLSKVAIVSLVIVSIFYIVLSLSSSKYFKLLSIRVNNNIDGSQKSVFIFFSNLKEIYINKKGLGLVHDYEICQENLSRDRTNSNFIGTSSRSFLEIFLFTGMILYLLIWEPVFEDFLGAVIASLLVLQRIAPYAQSMYASNSVINANKSEIYAALDLILKYNVVTRTDRSHITPLIKDIKPGVLIFSTQNVVIERAGTLLHMPDIQLTLGEKVGCMGASGVGKSSLADLIFGLLDASKGEVYRHESLNYHSNNSNVSYISQNPCFFPGTLISNLTGELNELCIDMGRLNFLIEKTLCFEFIGDRLHKEVGPLVSSFSGGQIKRLALVRALYKSPNLLILDEFTTGISDHQKMDLLNYIYGIQNLSIFHISHNFSDLEKSDRIIKI
jgi:ABC-type multidrug transport system fused ATPase/permease subunit